MGYVQIIRDFDSPPEGLQRRLRIYTPDAYDSEPDRRFPVVYMQDGQNIFSHPESALFHTWCANATMQRMVEERRIAPWVIVAVDHGPDRFAEYSPWAEPRFKADGRGQLYGDFLVSHLKPWVDRTYRTLADAQSTAIMGSALGGLISLWTAMKWPDVFGRVAGISPSLMWADRAIFKEWSAHPGRWTRVYLDSGASEHVTFAGVGLDYAAAARDFFEHLKKLGYADWELRLVLEPNGNHHEIDWRRRLSDVWEWLLT
jgi:predicted alpha/beta superfamily hydrolase